MNHPNAPLSIGGRRRLIERCKTRPIAHVAAEMGISRACASKWVNRDRQFGTVSLADRSSEPHTQPAATSPEIATKIANLRRTHKWSSTSITFELQAEGLTISRRTVSRHLLALGLNRRKFIDSNGEANREPRKMIARRPGHMVHIDYVYLHSAIDGYSRLAYREAPRTPSPRSRSCTEPAPGSPHTESPESSAS